MYQTPLVIDNISNDRAKLQTLVTILLTSLSHDGRDVFAQFCSVLQTTPVFVNELPTTTNEIDNTYMKRKHSVLCNIPAPSVEEVDSHAYTSVIQCVADLLGQFYSDFDNIVLVQDRDANVTKMSESDRGQDILAEFNNNHLYLNESDIEHLNLYALEWSDDFEPAKSIKCNRGNAWMKTITISPTMDNIHSGRNTYVIAIGSKKVSHEMVERKFAEEINLLREGKLFFYLGRSKKTVTISLTVLASLFDQPERRKRNGMMLGNGKYFGRWGHLVQCKSFDKTIASCQDCYRRLELNTFSPTDTCPNCVNWDTSLIRYPKPTNYPNDINQGNHLLSSVPVTYRFLDESVTLTESNI